MFALYLFPVLNMAVRIGNILSEKCQKYTSFTEPSRATCGLWGQGEIREILRKSFPTCGSLGHG